MVYLVWKEELEKLVKGGIKGLVITIMADTFILREIMRMWQRECYNGVKDLFIEQSVGNSVGNKEQY